MDNTKGQEILVMYLGLAESSLSDCLMILGKLENLWYVLAPPNPCCLKEAVSSGLLPITIREIACSLACLKIVGHQFLQWAQTTGIIIDDG